MGSLETACVNVSGLLMKQWLLALMESARTDPPNDGGHRRTIFGVKVTMGR